MNARLLDGQQADKENLCLEKEERGTRQTQ